MGWTVWILASACFLAFYDLAKKASVCNNAVLPVLLCSTSFGCLAYVAGLAASGHLNLVASADVRTVTLAAVKSVIVATSWVFTFCALRTLPITIATPIRASAPALVIVLAAVLYGELPGPLRALGMALVLAGYWAFSWAGRHEGIDFRHSRAVACAVAGAVLSAASALWDKYVFQIAAAPLNATQLVFQAGLVGFYAAALALAALWAAVRGQPTRKFEWRWTIPLVGTLLSASDWLMFNGLALPATPVSAASLLRRFSVVITFALGALCFHETNLRRKSLALLLVLAGVALIGWTR